MRDEAARSRQQEGWKVLHAATHHAEQRLGSTLLAAYAIGSLAHGGFAPAVSDIDLALLTTEPTPDMAQVVQDLTAAISPTHQLGARLSVFYCPWERFADPAPGARFPPIDRFDLLQYGILLHGKELRDTSVAWSTVQEIRAHAAQSALRRITPELLAQDLEQLETDGVTVHDASKLVLWPVRLQHVCDTGRATGNADAVNHYLTLPDTAHHSLVQDALAWRDHSSLPDPADALRRITREIRPLHAEVFRRLGGCLEIPHHRELAARAQLIAAES